MSAIELQKLVGKKASLTVLLSLSVPVKILDAKSNFGRTDCLVTPIGGAGERWVSTDSLTLAK